MPIWRLFWEQFWNRYFRFKTKTKYENENENENETYQNEIRKMANVDELADALGGAFQVTTKLNDPTRPHPRFSQYKQKNQVSNQEKRRGQILEAQKQRRQDFLAIARNIASNDFEEDEEEFEECDESMDTSDIVRKYRVRQKFSNQLMESEWLVEIPQDFQSNWIMVPVPEGRRCLLIAGYGTTCHYSRSGHFINQFPSLLPGGNRKRDRDKITFLDCIYVQVEGTYYVLDVMVWKDFSYYDCDTECRFFMLKSRLDENPELAIKSKINPYIFKALPSYACTPNAMQTALVQDLSFHPLPLDGLLFYSKLVQYLPGSTPLVGWLKGYMVPEMLNIPVSQVLMDQRPNSYASMKNYIKDYDEERAKKNKARENKDDEPEKVME